ncbi:hypothetical protein ACM39_07085 [Chryseobacterium sp. FH2]|uniref:hypothetical protein n=1 Tax=Chryseobacterium sp. FH2 TaxID=1674291 RepID=UPI00065AC678|nr:hypothetical protein [Chryseobacterium sp. FH2]KMQ69030.1 hypothetical protein ACM39_07085 [Chryseobacterium sp. FH2]
MSIFNSPSSHSKIEKIHQFITLNKGENFDFWEEKGFQDLHVLLLALSDSEVEKLGKRIENWTEYDQAILTDCVAHGIDNKFDLKYDDKKKSLITKLYSHVPYFSHPDIKKWRKNYRANSKTKSNNLKVFSIYDYLLKNEYRDSDFWSLGGGNDEIQCILNNFNDSDWKDLKEDLLNWSNDHQTAIVNAVPFGFDRIFASTLQERMISQAGNFLLDVFVLLDDTDIRLDISYHSFFINMGNTQQVEKLKFVKDWMLKNGFDYQSWKQSTINPITNIEEAINKANNSF